MFGLLRAEVVGAAAHEAGEDQILGGVEIV